MQLTKVQQRIVDILRDSPEGCPLGVLELKLEDETLPMLVDSLNVLKSKNVIAYGAHGVHLDASYLAVQDVRPDESVQPDSVFDREKAPARQRRAGDREVASASASRKKAADTSSSQTVSAPPAPKHASASSAVRGPARHLAGASKRGVALCEWSRITLLDLTESQRNRLAQLRVETVGSLVKLLGQTSRAAELDEAERDVFLQVLRDAARNVIYPRARLYLGALGEMGPNGLFFNAFGALCVLVGVPPKGYLLRQDDGGAQVGDFLSSVIDAVLWNWALPCKGKRQKALVSAIAMYMRARSSRFSLEDQTDSGVVERVLIEYLGPAQLVYSCAAWAHAWHEECTIRYKSGFGLSESLRIAPNTYWTDALGSLRQTCGPDFSVSVDRKSVRFAPKPLDAWLHSMEDSTRRVVFMSLLRGDTLDAIEDTVGVTKLELKKIIHEEFAKAPVLMEDRLLAKVKEGQPSFTELSIQTGADMRANLYLYLRYAKELGCQSGTPVVGHAPAKVPASDGAVQALTPAKGVTSAPVMSERAVKAVSKDRSGKPSEVEAQKMRAPVFMVEERTEERSHQEPEPVQEPRIACIEDVVIAEKGFGETPVPVTYDSAIAALGLLEESVHAFEDQGVHNVGRMFEVLKEKDARIGPRARRDLLKSLKSAAFPVSAAKAVPFLTARGKRRPGGFYFNPFGLLCVAPPAAPRPSLHGDVDRRAPILTSELGRQAIGAIGTSPKTSAKLVSGGIIYVSDLYGRDEYQLVSACNISLDDATEVLRLFDAYLSENGCIIPSTTENDRLLESRRQMMEIAPERLNALDSAISHLKLGCSDVDLCCLYSVLLPEVRRFSLSAEEDQEHNPSAWLNVLVDWFGERQLEQTCLAMMEDWRATRIEAGAQGEPAPTFRMADVPFWRAAAEEFSRKHDGEVVIAGHSLLLRSLVVAKAAKSTAEDNENHEVMAAQMVVDALNRIVQAPTKSILLALSSVHEAGSVGVCAEKINDKADEETLDAQRADDVLNHAVQVPGQAMRPEFYRVCKDEQASARNGNAIGVRTGEGDANTSCERAASG